MKSINQNISKKIFNLAVMLTAFLWIFSNTVFAYDDIMYWEDTEACWEEVEDAQRYQVRLYRGDTAVVTKTVENPWYDFESYMKEHGKYRFKVRARVGGEYGKWSSYSEVYTVGYSYSDIGSSIYWPTVNFKNNTYTGSTTSTTTSSVNNPEKMVVSLHEGWQKDQNGWWYRKVDGSYPKDSWYKIGNDWYNFDSKGYMRTGWIKRNQSWFYCRPTGEMVHGWQNINNNWYYFDENGYMLSNTVTPDGYQVGADGAWIQ